MNKEEGKEKRTYSESVELFEGIFKEAAPSPPRSNEDIPVPRQKPLQKSYSADAPEPRSRMKSQERTFKVRIKDGRTVPADIKEPQQSDLPMTAQAEPYKKTQKKTTRKARPVAVAGLVVLIVAAAGVFLHSFGALDLPSVPEFLGFNQKAASPTPSPQQTARKTPGKAVPPKSDTARPVGAASPTQPSATRVPPAEAVEKPAPSSPERQSQPPEGLSAKESVRPAGPLPSAREGVQTTEPLPLSAQVTPGAATVSIEVVPKRQEAFRRPYSLYLGSFSTPEQARKALAVHHREDFAPYAVRMDFGDKGVWYRIFMGHFQTREEAEGFVAKHKIQGVEVKETKYAVCLGTFVADDALLAKKNSLSNLGFFPYTIRETDGRVSLYTGAFPRKEDAEKEREDLKAKGIQAEPVER
jgi:hypothetical protein